MELTPSAMSDFLHHLRLEPVYLGFTGREDVFNEFQKEDDGDIVICWALYRQECYEGNAMVIYSRKSTGMFYEAYGSHCSCHGLEGQWLDRDEHVFPMELEIRINKGNLYDDGAMGEALEEWKKSRG